MQPNDFNTHIIFSKRLYKQYQAALVDPMDERTNWQIAADLVGLSRETKFVMVANDDDTLTLELIHVDPDAVQEPEPLHPDDIPY